MRVPRKIQPIQPLTYLWEKHKEIARLEVTGLRPKDIADRLRMTYCRVSIIMNSPVYKEFRNSLSGKRDEEALDIKKELLRGAEKGVQVLNDFLNDREVPAKTKATIAMDFLDRTGFGKSSTVNTTVTNVFCTSSRIEQIKEAQRALMSGMSGRVVEVEVEGNNG